MVVLVVVVELTIELLLFNCKYLFNLDVNCSIKDPFPQLSSAAAAVVVGRDSVEDADECNHTSIRIVVSILAAVLLVVGCFLLFDFWTPTLEDGGGAFRILATMPLINGENGSHSSDMAKSRHISQ